MSTKNGSAAMANMVKPRRAKQAYAKSSCRRTSFFSFSLVGIACGCSGIVIGGSVLIRGPRNAPTTCFGRTTLNRRGQEALKNPCLIHRQRLALRTRIYHALPQVMPGKSPNRRCEVTLHLYEYGVIRSWGAESHSEGYREMFCATVQLLRRAP